MDEVRLHDEDGPWLTLTHTQVWTRPRSDSAVGWPHGCDGTRPVSAKMVRTDRLAGAKWRGTETGRARSKAVCSRKSLESSQKISMFARDPLPLLPPPFLVATNSYYGRLPVESARRLV